MFLVPSGVTLEVVDVEVELFAKSTPAPGVIVSRFAQGSGHIWLTGVTLLGGKTTLPVDTFNATGGLLAYARDGGLITLDRVIVRDLDARGLAGAAAIAETGSRIIIAGESTFERIQGLKGPVATARFDSTLEVRPTVEGTPGPGPVFRDNSAVGMGGALVVEADFGDSTFVPVLGGTFDGNTAGEKGGHIAVFNADLSVDAVKFLGGRASAGGAVYVNGGSLVLTNSELTGNNARSSGGAIGFVSGTTLTLVGNDLTANTATSSGGGIYLSAAAGLQTLVANRFCANDGILGDQLYSENGSSVLDIRHNLFDGDGAGASTALVLVNQSYVLAHSTVVRTTSPAVRAITSSGTVSRNFFGWIDAPTPFSLDSAASTPSLIADNVWFDATNAWDDPMVRDGGGRLGPGPGARVGNPDLTGTRGDGELSALCAVSDHHLRPNSLLLDATWTPAITPDKVRGFLGGPQPFARETLNSWVDDQDRDGIVALWDCDDADSGLGRLCIDGPDTGDTGDSGDTDRVDSDTVDTDTMDTDPGADTEAYWYGTGGCSGTGPGGMIALGAALGAGLAITRRRRRV
jgi:hypothetical protein